MTKFDLLGTVEYGGCSAKLPATELSRVLKGLPETNHPNLLVGTDTHDDAGVYKISDQLALIQTTDFFPPVCSDPYEFGQIAATNAMSDIYAMGGKVLSALNIVAFPAGVPLEVLKEILRGGIEKVIEAGGVIMGGHTIVDEIPKYGLAVTGTVHPDRIITNAKASPGDVLILTKPLGTGTIMAGNRIGEVKPEHYRVVIESMKQLNKDSLPAMLKYGVKCATDITGFGLAGHSMKMATASGVTIRLHAGTVKPFEGAIELLELGCIPGACFRNLEFIDNDTSFDEKLKYEHKMLMTDAQTSGGLLICCKKEFADDMVKDLIEAGYPHTGIVGNVISKSFTDTHLIVLP